MPLFRNRRQWGDLLEGWVSLYRQIQKSWLWEEKPFSRGQAWIDMLLSANHKDSKVHFDGKLHEVKRGSFITSIRKLCERWGWSNTKVKSFLDLCVVEEMITYKSDTKKTVVTIVNYDLYQNPNDTEASQKHHRNDTETSQKHTNNNDNNINLLSLYNKELLDGISPEAEKKLLEIRNGIFG